jgi:hypothetical protein
VTQDLEGIDRGHSPVAVHVAPEGRHILPYVRAGLVLGDAELCDVPQFFQGVDRADVAVAVDVALG